MSQAPAPHPRLIKFMRAATVLLAVAIPLCIVVVGVFWTSILPEQMTVSGIALAPHTISNAGKLGVIAVSLAGGLVQSYGLIRLSDTFAAAQEAQAFSAKSLRGFRIFSLICLAMVPLSIIVKSASVAIATATDALPGAALPIAIGSSELRSLFIAILLVFVGHIFEQGRAAVDETNTFI